MTIVLMAIAIMSANAQNIQLHYDFGRHLYPDQEENRQSATTRPTNGVRGTISWMSTSPISLWREPILRSHASSISARKALPPMWSMMAD